jgi:hypothetical protein
VITSVLNGDFKNRYEKLRSVQLAFSPTSIMTRTTLICDSSWELPHLRLEFVEDAATLLNSLIEPTPYQLKPMIRKDWTTAAAMVRICVRFSRQRSSAPGMPCR